MMLHRHFEGAETNNNMTRLADLNQTGEGQVEKKPEQPKRSRKKTETE